MLCAMV